MEKPPEVPKRKHPKRGFCSTVGIPLKEFCLSPLRAGKNIRGCCYPSGSRWKRPFLLGEGGEVLKGSMGNKKKADLYRSALLYGVIKLRSIVGISFIVKTGNDLYRIVSLIDYKK